MTFQTVIFRVKALLPLPRVLNGARWMSMGLLCITIGIFAAGVFETQFLSVPFQPGRYIPPFEKKVSTSMTIEEFEPIITHNIFDAEISGDELVAKEELVPVQPGVNLKQILANLQLMGISVLQGDYAVCVIRDNKQRKEEIFAVNDTVFNTRAVIRKILSRDKEQKVYLQLNEEVGVLTYKEDLISQNRPISPSGSGSGNSRSSGTKNTAYSTDGRNFHISSEEVEAQLNDFAKLLNQARMVPYFKRGKHKGYQVKAIDKGSLYEKLGLKNRDVIEEINGEPLDSMEKVMGLFKNFRNEREFTIKVSRKGNARFMNYYID